MLNKTATEIMEMGIDDLIYWNAGIGWMNKQNGR
jgi:hypothetical protein